MSRKCLAVLCLASLGTPLWAEISQVDFADFPKGTKCSASGAAGTVKVREKRNEIEVKIKGSAKGAKFFCTLPDGRTARAILPKVPEGARANLQTWSDGTGKLIMSVDGNLVLQDVPKAIAWSN